jgi:ferric-dicitrate binding protein FerR (iron transport regulator)
MHRTEDHIWRDGRMTKPQRDDERSLHDLLAKLLDGSITESQHHELQNRLRDDPVAQQAYFDYLDLDTDLREMSMATGGTSAQPVSSAASPSESINTKRNAQLTGWKRFTMLLTLAASLLLMASLVWWNRGSQVAMESRHDVVLVQSAGGELYRDILPSIGRPLQNNHEYALTAGFIELKFANGAEVILEAPAVLEIAAADRLIVKHGSCSVHAPPGAEGFQVITPQTDVTDLGTRFSVLVGEGGETEVHVVEGAAEARPRDNSEAAPLLLKQHQASRFSGNAMLSIDFTPNRYRRDLPDRVVGFQVGTTDGRLNGQLERVTVQRAGIPRAFDARQLIGIEVTHFRGGSNSHCLSVAMGSDVNSVDNRRRVMESDLLLHTGFLNPGGSTQSLTHDPNLSGQDDAEPTPGLAIRFREPVINGPGPDVVFFEMQSVVDPMDGDGFHVSPLRFAPGLRSWTVTRYDITLQSPEAQLMPSFDLLQFDKNVGSLEDLLTGTYQTRKPAIPFWVIAVGIDLSDLGYAAGTPVDGLFFQDAVDDEHLVDPVFVAGLASSEDEAQ